MPEWHLFGPESIFISGASTDAFVADVNQDGAPDLLISNSGFFEEGYSTGGGNAVTELLNLGPRTNPNLTASNTNLTSSSQSFLAGTSVTFTATTSGSSSSSGEPTGTIRFADQTGIESTVALIPSGSTSASATFTTNMIGVGADTMSATYSGDNTFAQSTSTTPLAATGIPDAITVTVTQNPVPVGYVATLNVSVANSTGSSAAIPAGYIEFLDGSTIVGGPNTLSNGSTAYNVGFSSAGQHTLSVRYSGDLIHLPNTATLIETVLISPSVSIRAPTSVTTTQVLSPAITVSGGPGNPIPTGSVTLTASTTIGGSGYTSPAATLNNGSATINIPAGTLAAGTYWLTPTYIPDAASSSTYLSSSSTGTNISVTAPPPAITITGSSVTIAPGETTGNTSTITVTPSEGFTGSVALSATIASSPKGAQYPPTLSFGSTSPVNVTGTKASTATLTVLTTAPTRSALTVPAQGVPWYASGGATMACILLFWIRPTRRSWRTMLGMFVLLAVLGGGVLACGGGGGGVGGGTGGGSTTNPGTTTGTYTITISGTSSTTSATGTITLVVQ